MLPFKLNILLKTIHLTTFKLLNAVFALIFFTYLPESQISFYSNKFFHNFHLSDFSNTCPWLLASGLAQTAECTHQIWAMNCYTCFCFNQLHFSIIPLEVN
jgi:non-ribosomal peptide synthetase component F